MIYTIGICDDERSICSELEKNICDFFNSVDDDVEVIVWNDAESFMSDVPSKMKVDILFLDIQLPGINGVHVGKYIREICNDEAMHIIFISSKDSYAMELFEIHPYDFLVKPIDKNKVCKIVNKLFQLNEQDERFFVYYFNKKQYRVTTGSIIYFISERKNIHIVTLTDTNHYIGKLKKEADKLPSNFIRINQSYIINIRRIKQCNPDNVIMCNGEVLNIGRKYRSDFNKRMIEYNRVKR